MISRFQAELLAPMLEPFCPKAGNGADENRWCLPEDTLRQAGIQESVFDDHPWYEGKGIDGQGRSVHVIDLEGFEQYRSGHVTRQQERRLMKGVLER